MRMNGRIQKHANRQKQALDESDPLFGEQNRRLHSRVLTFHFFS